MGNVERNLDMMDGSESRNVANSCYRPHQVTLGCRCPLHLIVALHPRAPNSAGPTALVTLAAGAPCPSAPPLLTEAHSPLILELRKAPNAAFSDLRGKHFLACIQ